MKFSEIAETLGYAALTFFCMMILYHVGLYTSSCVVTAYHYLTTHYHGLDNYDLSEPYAGTLLFLCLGFLGFRYTWYTISKGCSGY